MTSADNFQFPDKQTKPKMTSVNFDQVLEDEVGSFGWFQKRVILLAGLLVVFLAWSNNEYVFTTARITTRCHIPECDLEEPEFHSEWLLSAIPGSSLAALDNCQRYAANASAALAHDVCPPDWFDRDQLESCERHLYENTDTVVYVFDLACDEWRRALIGSMKVFGMLLGVPLTGYVSDHFGRRTAAVITAVNCAWIGILRFFTNTYIGFIISVFAESAVGSAYTAVFILMMEIVGPKFRVVVGATLTTFFSVGQMLMALIAWGVPNWKHLTLALYAPQFITIAYFWLLPESFRWYMSTGRYEESQNALKKIAKVNKKTLSEKSLLALRQFAEEEKARQEKLKEQRKNDPWLIVLVIRHKEILIRCLVSPIWWITTTFIYYGLTINAVNMSGNRFVNYIAVMAAQIPGYWTGVFLIEKIGRKPALITAFWLCAACQIGYIFMPEGQYALSLALYLAGTYCISNVATAIYSYTAELYPTKYRNSLFAFSSTMGRIGSILAPLTPALGAAVWDKLPFALFAGLACLSGALVFITPETRGTKFPDTMEEASELGRKNKRISTKL